MLVLFGLILHKTSTVCIMFQSVLKVMFFLAMVRAGSGTLGHKSLYLLQTARFELLS